MKPQIIHKKKHTGRHLVLLNADFKRDTLFKAAKSSSVTLVHFNDYIKKPDEFMLAFSQGDGIYFENLHVAVLNNVKEEERIYMRKGLEQKEFMATEPERYVYEIGKLGEFKKKYKDDSKSSWGIKATRVTDSHYSGKGISIAVLDTGLFKEHIDLKGRKITTRKFVSSGSAGDADGHGSHCVGVACGNTDETGMRYGVAYGSHIFCGKVLNDQGEGTDSGILAGIEWAMKNKCRIISMSLGAAAEVNEAYSLTYENVAKRAMKLGSLIIAAAGNESNRPVYVAPVGHPANCPSIMAVGAVDNNLRIAGFSCGGISTIKGGQVDIVAPGVSVYSMINRQHEHDKWDGTSMATPFVSGIAGLYFEQNPGASPLDVWTLMTQHARRLNLSSEDAGSGLVQAPLD